MKKNLVIVVLLAIIGWLSLQVIRLERYHYSVVLGECMDQDPQDRIPFVSRDECLLKSDLRTSPIWHLYYGAIDPYYKTSL